MPNEIYHRSEWGNPKAEGFGDVYFDASATNKLYNHSDNYENSDGTDKILRDIPNKASIVLTPTAYSDGSLNTVIPPYGFGSELIVNGDFASGTSPFDAFQCTLSNVNNTLVATATSANDSRVKQAITTVSGKKYKITADLLSLSGSKVGVTNRNGNSFSYSGDNDERTTSGQFVFFFTAESTTTSVVFKMFDASIGESFSIDNVSVKEVQEADFDFSRGSSATRVNEKGLIEDVQILSGELVQNGDFEQIGSELITNGNFDTDSDWSKGGNTTIDNGKASFNGVSSYVYQNILTIGKTYTCSVSVKDWVSGVAFSVGSSATGSGTIYSSITRQSNTITTFTFTAVSTTLGIGSRSFNIEGSIDNVSVKEVGQNWDFVGDFETDGTKAFITSASQYSQLTNQTGVNYLLSGNKYRLTFDIPTLSISGAFAYRYTGGSVTPILTSDIQNGKFTTEFTMPSNGWFWLQTTGSYTGLNVEVDNISVIEITDDTDIPRIDYTSGQGALLLEPQRTNSVTYSEELTTNWTRTSISTPTDANIDAPDGASTVKRLQTNNADGSIAFTYNTGFNQTSGTTYTVSVYAKSNTNENQIFGLFGNGSGASNGHSGNLTATNDWQRFTYTFTANNTSTIGICKGDDRLAFDILFWGFQIEAGSYATSYIPTEGATVTRSADVANNSGNADLFNDSEGVLYFEAARLNSEDNSSIIFSISDGSNSNAVSMYYYSGGIGVDIFNSLGTKTILHSISLNQQAQFNKLAIKYKSNDIALWFNGNEVATNTDAINLTGLNELKASYGNGQFPFYGNVKSLAVFKEALTDEELQALTT